MVARRRGFPDRERSRACSLVLLGLGVQAALFGPVKYGLLPELLAEDELVAGNGVIEATTFLSIVCGTVAGGALVLLPHGTAWSSAPPASRWRCSACSARMRDPACAGRRSGAAHRAEPVRRDLARSHAMPLRSDPSGSRSSACPGSGPSAPR